jgi:hypothetical protein
LTSRRNWIGEQLIEIPYGWLKAKNNELDFIARGKGISETDVAENNQGRGGMVVLLLSGATWIILLWTAMLPDSTSVIVTRLSDEVSTGSGSDLVKLASKVDSVGN